MRMAHYQLRVYQPGAHIEYRDCSRRTTLPAIALAPIFRAMPLRVQGALGRGRARDRYILRIEYSRYRCAYNEDGRNVTWLSRYMRLYGNYSFRRPETSRAEEQRGKSWPMGACWLNRRRDNISCVLLSTAHRYIYINTTAILEQPPRRSSQQVHQKSALSSFVGVRQYIDIPASCYNV